MPTQIEIRVNEAVWVSINLSSPLDKQVIQVIDDIFPKIITDKNADKGTLGPFVIDPRPISAFKAKRRRENDERQE